MSERADLPLVADDSIVWFESKVDWWVAVLLVATPLITLAAAVLAVAAGGALLPAVLPCLFIAALYFGLVLPVRYGVSSRELIIRHGLVRRRIRIDSITRIRASHNPLSSPALSLDRLRVDYRGWLRAVLISPNDKAGFIRLLSLRAGRSIEDA